MKGPVNLGSNEEITIGSLAKLIVMLCGTGADITFDSSKPEGQPRRACDTTTAREILGFEAQVPLHEGLKNAIEWYQHEKRLKSA
jgi:GDP-L-fucose synthase